MAARLVLGDVLSDGRIVDDAAGLGESVGAVIKIILPLHMEATEETTIRAPVRANA